MKQLSFLLMTLTLLISCHEKTPNEITIEGNVTNIPDGKIYLTEAHRWNIPLDSTVCKNGHFIFKIIPDSSFIPYMASINFPDSSKSSKISSLLFRNFTFGADSMKFSYNSFYLEKGNTRIEGDNSIKPYLRVFSGKETEVMFKNQMTDFGWLGNLDSAKRLSKIESFKKQIKEYPFSYFLLNSIYECKEQYSEKELQTIFYSFEQDIQKSKLGDKIKTYLKNRPDPNKPYSNLLLLNSNNQRQYIIDTTAKLNMLVFWASWCGPCRMEIPLLKEIQRKYQNKGLNLVNISIDVDKANWAKALADEKMQWSQCLVDKENLDEVMQQFNFSSIPLVVFTDKSGYEVAKIYDYYKENKQKYEAIISKFIK